MEIINTIGRRKTSVARIYFKQGEGKLTINSKDLLTYFPSEILRTIINQPFAVTNTENQYDVVVNVQGGGTSSQAEAIRLAIARALVEVDENMKPALKEEGFMTRDPRMVERKKYGRRKARKRFQFSKR